MRCVQMSEGGFQVVCRLGLWFRSYGGLKVLTGPCECINYSYIYDSVCQVRLQLESTEMFRRTRCCSLFYACMPVKLLHNCVLNMDLTWQ